MSTTDRRGRKRKRSGRRGIGARSGAGALAACTALVLLLAAGLLWAAGGPAAGRIGGPFHLVDTDARPVSDQDFRGRWMLVYFGYTNCPDVCPTTLHEVGAAMQALGPDAARVRPLFITVDPARDTPATLRDYLAGFGTPMDGLTGTAEQVTSAERAYRITSAPHHTSRSPGYVVDHGSVLFLMGPDGRFVAPIPADATGEAIAHEIRRWVG